MRGRGRCGEGGGDAHRHPVRRQQGRRLGEPLPLTCQVRIWARKGEPNAHLEQFKVGNGMTYVDVSSVASMAGANAFSSVKYVGALQASQVVS